MTMFHLFKTLRVANNGLRSSVGKYCGNLHLCPICVKDDFLERNVHYDVTNTIKDEKDKSVSIVLSDDGNTVVCWHPEQSFPYDCSKAIPRFDPELNEFDSVLKVQHRQEHKQRHKLDLTMEDLQKITYTTKHKWYPNNQKKKRKPNPPVDREGI